LAIEFIGFVFLGLLMVFVGLLLGRVPFRFAGRRLHRTGDVVRF
jgi:hypothetical protein